MSVIFANVQSNEFSSAQALVDRSVEQTRWARKQFDTRYQCRLVTVTENLNDEDEVKDTERREYFISPIRSHAYKELVSVNNRPLNVEERIAEEEYRRKFIEAIAAGEPLPQREEDQYAVVYNEEFTSRYDFTFAGRDTVKGTPVAILQYRPKDGPLPVTRQLDRGLNRSQGRFFIRPDNGAVVYFDFGLLEEMKFMKGLLGGLHELDGRMWFTRLEPGLWLPKSLRVLINLRIAWVIIHQRITMEWSDYQKVRW